jgi:hypothetical protein
VGLAGLVGIIAAMLLTGCAPSEEETLSSKGYKLVGNIEESTVWVSAKPDDDGNYDIEVAGKLRGMCNGAVLAGIGEQICNMGEPERGSLYMVGAPTTATAGTITLTDGKSVRVQTFDVPTREDVKLAVGTSPSSHARGFFGIEFSTASGAVLDRSGQQKQ